jgi:hypothetical protein
MTSQFFFFLILSFPQNNVQSRMCYFFGLVGGGYQETGEEKGKWMRGWMICREHEQTRSATEFQQPTGIQEINNIKNSKHRQKHSFCSFLLGLLAHLNGVFSTRHVTIITSSKVSWYKSNTQTEGYFHLLPSLASTQN